MDRLVPLFVVMLVSLPFLGSTAVAEDPFNQDCDGIAITRLLCAGADAGGNAECDDANQAEISCSYAYSWNLNASSPAQLPGEGRLEWSYQVSYCISGNPGLCAAVEFGGGVKDCAWLVNELDPCYERALHTGSLDFTLELGQCVTVTATASGSAEAWSTDKDDPLLHAETQDSQPGSGAACYLDDGR